MKQGREYLRRTKNLWIMPTLLRWTCVMQDLLHYGVKGDGLQGLGKIWTLTWKEQVLQFVRPVLLNDSSLNDRRAGKRITKKSKSILWKWEKLLRRLKIHFTEDLAAAAVAEEIHLKTQSIQRFPKLALACLRHHPRQSAKHRRSHSWNTWSRWLAEWSETSEILLLEKQRSNFVVKVFLFHLCHFVVFWYLN